MSSSVRATSPSNSEKLALLGLDLAPQPVVGNLGLGPFHDRVRVGGAPQTTEHVRGAGDCGEHRVFLVGSGDLRDLERVVGFGVLAVVVEREAEQERGGRTAVGFERGASQSFGRDVVERNVRVAGRGEEDIGVGGLARFELPHRDPARGRRGGDDREWRHPSPIRGG